VKQDANGRRGGSPSNQRHEYLVQVAELNQVAWACQPAGGYRKLDRLHQSSNFEEGALPGRRLMAPTPQIGHVSFHGEY
jgi:hypothetical protein